MNSTETIPVCDAKNKKFIIRKKIMSHYFIEDKNLKSDHKIIYYDFRGDKFAFHTDAGVFSKGGVDRASDALVNAVPPLTGSLLDMGCGYGCVGVALAKAYGLALTQADVNGAAVGLAKQNAAVNGVNASAVVSDCFLNITGAFDTIAINPPVRAGKAVTYRMYAESAHHLNPGGRLFVVNLKKQGAESTREKLAAIYGNCDTIYKKKGIYVFCCVKM